jgi:hypothetical protein
MAIRQFPHRVVQAPSSQTRLPVGGRGGTHLFRRAEDGDGRVEKAAAAWAGPRCHRTLGELAGRLDPARSVTLPGTADA